MAAVNRPVGVGRAILWSAAAGTAFALVGLVAAPLAQFQFSSVLDSAAGSVTWLSFASGIYLTAALLWWLLLVQPRHLSPRRGAMVGVLIALFCYPVVLLLNDLFGSDLYTLTNGATLAARALNLLLLTALTLLTTGFAATLAMAATGAVVAWALLRLDPAAAALAATPRSRASGGLTQQLFRIVAGLAMAIVLLLVSAFAGLTLLPLHHAGLAATASPAGKASDYASALAAFDSVAAEEASMPLDPRCRSTLLTHGNQTARVVIFFHGLTNCPAQFEQLAAQLFAQGNNVYVPRLPGHGMADPLTLALADLTAEALVDTANGAIDLAHGLGGEVVVSGLSAGGTLAAWTAQNRGDVDRVLAISPFIGPAVVPPWAMRAATNLLLLAPNLMVWWDADAPFSSPTMSYAYPRYATRALAQIMRLGGGVIEAAHQAAPAVPHITMLLNAGDATVSPALNEDLLAAWRQQRPDVTLRLLPAKPMLPHDLIDPNQPEGDITEVYPIVIHLLSGATAP